VVDICLVGGNARARARATASVSGIFRRSAPRGAHQGELTMRTRRSERASARARVGWSARESVRLSRGVAISRFPSSFDDTSHPLRRTRTHSSRSARAPTRALMPSSRSRESRHAPRVSSSLSTTAERTWLLTARAPRTSPREPEPLTKICRGGTSSDASSNRRAAFISRLVTPARLPRRGNGALCRDPLVPPRVSPPCRSRARPPCQERFIGCRSRVLCTTRERASTAGISVPQDPLHDAAPTK
jgi:hypothetical protein